MLIIKNKITGSTYPKHILFDFEKKVHCMRPNLNRLNEQRVLVGYIITISSECFPKNKTTIYMIP